MKLEWYYIKEAERIAELQRRLDARYHLLIERVREKHPEVFEYDTDYMFAPHATTAEGFSKYIQENATKVGDNA